VSRFQVHPITSAVLREDGEAQILPAELEARVASVWRRECAARAEAIEDAPIFNVTRFGADEIAQLRHPELREILRVQPGTVCALSFFGDSLLFGRRSLNTTQDPGVWEPVPAGGIGPESCVEDGNASARLQLQRELEEEMGLCVDQIAHIRPFALVVDFETRVHDSPVQRSIGAGSIGVLCRSASIHHSVDARARAPDVADHRSPVGRPRTLAFPRLSAVRRGTSLRIRGSFNQGSRKSTHSFHLVGSPSILSSKPGSNSAT
jgi:hypothetical protein